MKAVETASREAWLAARKNYITASDAAAVLGMSPWRSRMEVWQDKRGMGLPVEETERMRLGRLLEPAILRRYQDDCDHKVHPNDQLYVADKVPFLAATPDAFVRNDAGTLVGLAQAKATSSTSGWHDGQPPIYYQVQAAVEMIVADAPWDDFPTLVAGSDYVCPRVERVASAEERILSELAEFWERYVIQGATPPPVSEQDIKVYSQMVPAIERKIISLPTEAATIYAAMRDAEKVAAAAEKEAKALKAQLLGWQGDAEVGVIPGTGMAMKRATVEVPAKQTAAYSFTRYSAAKWKGAAL